MDAKIGAAATQMTNNFEPSFDWVREDECDTLLVYLPGFTKEQLRVQLTRTRILKISGARPLGDNKWSRFQKDFTVSENCDTNKITAKFEEGILYVRQPKVIVPAAANNNNNNIKEENKIIPPPLMENSTPQSQLPAEHSAPPPKIVDQEHKTARVTHEDKIKEDATKIKDEKNPGNVVDDAEVAKKLVDNDDKSVAANVAAKPAMKLKKAREMTMMVLVVLIAFGFGIYVSNLGWFSRKN